MIELLTAILIGVFWVLFFTLDPEPQNAPDCYQVFERAFLLPDICLLNALINGWPFGFGIVLIVSFLPRFGKKAIVRREAS